MQQHLAEGMLGRLSLTVPPEEGKVIMSISPTIPPWQTLTLAVIVPVFICIHLSISVCKLCVTSFRYRACTNIYLLLFFLAFKIWWDWRIKAVFINWIIRFKFSEMKYEFFYFIRFQGMSHYYPGLYEPSKFSQWSLAKF